jgi:hypothetical protein
MYMKHMLSLFTHAYTQDPQAVEVAVEVVFLVVEVVVLVELVVDFFVVVVLLVVVDFLVVEVVLAETVLPAAEHGKSKLVSDSIFVQKYSELPLVPTRFVPVAVMSSQISEQTISTTSLLLVPVPVTLM